MRELKQCICWVVKTRMTEDKTSILLKDISIEGDLIEKEKIIVDAKVSGDIKAEDITTHQNSNINVNYYTGRTPFITLLFIFKQVLGIGKTLIYQIRHLIHSLHFRFFDVDMEGMNNQCIPGYIITTSNEKESQE